MNIFTHFEAEFETIFRSLQTVGTLPSDVDTSRVVCELPRDPAHGDLACNAAMVLARQAGMKPRDLAEALMPALEGVHRD